MYRPLLGVSAEPELVEPGGDVVAAAPPEPAGSTDAGIPLAIACFGTFEVRVEGRRVDLSRLRPRARQLLRLLALHAGTAVHREVLADALWPLVSWEAAMRNLQVSVSSLRTTFERHAPGRGGQFLERDGGAYLLVLSEQSACDLVAFERACAAAARARATRDLALTLAWLRTAVELYTGEVLPGDGPAEWVVTDRERYRMCAADAALALAELELRHGSARRAGEAARRAVDIDRFHDAGWRVLIEACTRSGDVAAAHRARCRYAGVLAELGMPYDDAPAGLTTGRERTASVSADR